VAHSEVVTGRAGVTVRGEIHTLLPGGSLTIEIGEAHSIRNSGIDTLVVRTTLRPPGEFETAIRALYEASAGGKPELLAVAATPFRFSSLILSEFETASPANQGT